MKIAKKLCTVLLALVMVFAMASPTFAETPAGTGGTITINHAVNGATYSVYKIFDLESQSGEHYVYKVDKKIGAANNPWYTFVTDTGSAGAKYISVEERDTYAYVTWKKPTDVGEATDEQLYAAFANAAKTYAETEGIVATESQNAGDSGTVTFSNLTLGYYMVVTSQGTPLANAAMCALGTTGKTLEEKNNPPTVSKKLTVEGNLVSANNAKVGDEIEFTIKVTTQAGKNHVAVGSGEGTFAKNYVLHDKMGTGLSLKKDTISVTYKNTPVKTTNYKVNIPGVEKLPANPCTFEIDFTEEYEANFEANQELVITYKATVTADAVNATNNTNKAWLTYTEDNTPTPDNPTTNTYTYAFKVFKYYLNDTAETPLAGATFSLYTQESCEEGNIVKFAKATNAGSEIANTYTHDLTGTITEFTSPDDGIFTLQGLKPGTYYLKEITEPTGYNKLAGPIKVVITDNKTNNEPNGTYAVTYANSSTTGGYETDQSALPDGQVATNEIAAAIPQVKVLNNTGTEFPVTGGVGTTIFYIVGGALVLGAVILFVVRRRMNQK